MPTLMSTIRMMSESAPAAKTNTVLDEAFEALIALEEVDLEEVKVPANYAQMMMKKNEFVKAIMDKNAVEEARQMKDQAAGDKKDKKSSANEEVEFDMNEAFEALDENLRSDIAKVSSKYPEGSSVKVKGKSVKVVSHGKDFLVVSAGKGTMNVNLKDVVKESKKPVSQMTPKEKAEHDKKRKEYNAYQKSKRNENIEEGAEVYTMKKGSYTRQVDGKEADKMKKQGWKLVGRVEKFPTNTSATQGKRMGEGLEESVELEEARIDAADYTVIAEDYFTVQYYDAKGKAEEGKFKEFKDEKSAKKHLDRANKVVKDGEYKMFKVKGSMDESVELEEHIRKNAQNTIKGNRYDMNTNSYGLTASLIAAVNDVVTGVEPSPAPAEAVNEIIENGPVDMQEATHEGLDKVNPTAVKKKFANRKDKDIDNDGDVDSSDEYLHKKRKAISKSMDEASIKEFKADGEDSETADPTDVKAKKPKKGKKDGDEEKKGGEKIEINPKLDEAPEMTDAQMKKREEIILSMKDKTPEFKKKYGDRWEDVMYATATKLAMK